jgi:hypothetical protein
MRRILTGFAVAAVAALVPAIALAGNQQVAEQIAHRLRDSGQMVNYKIGVKYQDGTVWLRGRVASQEQMTTALRLVSDLGDVSQVYNGLTVDSSEGQQTPSNYNPLRGPAAKPGLIKRLQAALSRNNESEAPQQATYADESQRSADDAVQPASAQEPQELPRQMVAAPKAARQPVKVARLQPTGRPGVSGPPLPMYTAANSYAGVAPARYDQPCMPNYAWPSYAAYPNYAAVTYPKQYSPTAWPYIGPFYPYPQVPLGWRKVTLEWDSGWWYLDFKDQPASCWHQ